MVQAQTQVVETLTNVPFQFNIKVSKVDAEKRLVTGIATCEAVDKSGEIVDYETAKKFFQNEDLWPGNIREMHQPKAVGKKVDVGFDDDNKVISLTSRVSKGAPETWEKVLDGTLSMYSIGGSGDRVVEKTADGKSVKRIFLKNLAEVSLVDNGANPMAKFDIVKMDAGKLIDAQPEEPTETETPEPVEKGTPEPQAAGDATTPVETSATGTTSTPAAADVAPEATVARRALVIGSLTKFVGSEAAAKSPMALTYAQTVLGAIEKMDTPESIAKGCPEPWDIDRALAAISMLENLLATEYWDAKYSVGPGETPDPAKLAQVKMLKTAVDMVLQFVVSEHNEQFDEPEDDGADMDAALVSDDTMVAMADAALDVIKAGARHSKKDMDLVQKMHDASVTLGAACVQKDDDAGDDDGDGDVDKSAKAAAAKAATTDVAKVDATPGNVATVAQSDDVNKLNRELSEAQTKIKEQGDEITALKDKVGEILKMARPGGPVVRAVAKSLGTQAVEETASAAPEAVTGSSLIAALQHVAANSNDQALKNSAALEITKILRATGEGRIDFNPQR